MVVVKSSVFDKAAHALIVNKELTPNTDGKSVRGRYKRLKRSFNKKNTEKTHSFLGWEVI